MDECADGCIMEEDWIEVKWTDDSHCPQRDKINLIDKQSGRMDRWSASSRPRKLLSQKG